MIGRTIGSGRGIAGMVAYNTHDQTSADNRRPTTSERVAWTACLGIPAEDTELMIRAMQGLTADAPALKAMAGISTRGRKLKNPYTHLVLSWPEGADAPRSSTCCRPSPARSTAFASTTATTRSAPRTPTRPARTCISPSAASTRRRAGPSTSTRAPRCASAGGRSSTSASTAASSCRRASNGARPRRRSATSSAAAARAGCRASRTPVYRRAAASAAAGEAGADDHGAVRRRQFGRANRPDQLPRPPSPARSTRPLPPPPQRGRWPTARAAPCARDYGSTTEHVQVVRNEVEAATR